MLMNVLFLSLKQACISLHRVAKLSGRKREREVDGGEGEKEVKSKDEMVRKDMQVKRRRQ